MTALNQKAEEYASTIVGGNDECIVSARTLWETHRDAYLAGYAARDGEDGWISVEERLPVKEDTRDEFYNEVLTIQLGTKRPQMVKYWEIKHNPFITHWTSLPQPPKQK